MEWRSWPHFRCSFSVALARTISGFHDTPPTCCQPHDFGPQPSRSHWLNTKLHNPDIGVCKSVGVLTVSAFIVRSAKRQRQVGHRGRQPGATLSTILLCTSNAASLEREVEHTVIQSCGLSCKSPALLIVSVSGGADSISLAVLLDRIIRRIHAPWILEVLHFNHGLRAESTEEEAFVITFARRHDLVVHVRHASTDRFEGHGSLQDAARNWRRSESLALLHSRLQTLNVGGAEHGVVMLAHHADDQVETRLLRLLRGAHIARLSGMRVRDGQFVRPLLTVQKSRLVSYLEDLGQPWREDASNSKLIYKRNKVRLQLVPLLADLCGGHDALHRRLCDLGDQSDQVAALLEEHCSEFGHVPFPKQGKASPVLPVDSRFHELPGMVQHEVMWRFVANCSGVMLGFQTVGRIVHAARCLSEVSADSPLRIWKLPVGKNWELERRHNKFVMRYVGSADFEVWQVGDLTVRRALDMSHVNFQVARYQDDESDVQSDRFGRRHRGLHDFTLHHVPRGFTLTLRGARAGDKLVAQPGARMQTLGQFLHRNMRIPPADRPDWPVVVLTSPETTEGRSSDALKAGIIVAVYPEAVIGYQGQSESSAGGCGDSPKILVSWRDDTVKVPSMAEQ